MAARIDCYPWRSWQSEGNIDKTLFERKPDNDHSLTEKGREQARECGRRLRLKMRDEPVYFQVSPYRRTRETLEMILTSFVDENGDAIPFSKFSRREAQRAEERASHGGDDDDNGESESHGSECGSPIQGSARGPGAAQGSAPICRSAYLRVRSKSIEDMLMSASGDSGEVAKSGGIFCWPCSGRYKVLRRRTCSTPPLSVVSLQKWSLLRQGVRSQWLSERCVLLRERHLDPGAHRTGPQVREDARLREQEFGNYQVPRPPLTPCTGRGTRRVRLVRGEGRGVST
jgi:hypothetical protein